MSEEEKANAVESENTLVTAEPQGEGGAFRESLIRTNSKIKKDRAIAIEEDAEIKYSRTIQDMELKLRQMLRDQNNMLDMSPENTTSLILASKFEAQEYVDLDIGLCVDMRNLKIKIDLARARYKLLFGKEA